jgi:hypothetical protein
MARVTSFGRLTALIAAAVIAVAALVWWLRRRVGRTV